MKHLPSTAKRNYVIKVNPNRAAKAHELMTSYIRATDQSSNLVDEERKSLESEKNEQTVYGPSDDKQTSYHPKLV